MAVELKAIPTRFKNFFFRSRLEARWCVLFEALGIDYTFEPEAFALSSGNYMPDFQVRGLYLRERPTPLWIEIKPTNPPEKELVLYRELAVASRVPLILLVAPHVEPNPSGYLPLANGHYEFSYIEHEGEGIVFEDAPLSLCKCHACGQLKFEFAESSYMTCPKCGEKCDDFHPDLRRFTARANQWRFNGRW